MRVAAALVLTVAAMAASAEPVTVGLDVSPANTGAAGNAPAANSLPANANAASSATGGTPQATAGASSGAATADAPQEPLPEAPLPKAGVPVVKVTGNKLVDGAGSPLQLRGVNVSTLEFYPILNEGGDYWGTQKPNIKAIRAWKPNAIRVPLN